ncbi:MAG: hypothetical protein DK306_002227 [Chloroflexi bacterium]|jgi:hypothetical protein|nr:MAG: hypothetical protein DK306_002227 [Chloroflexota bacterium]
MAIWGRRKRYLQPVIVPPVAGKRALMHESIVPLWAQARSALEQADSVIVFGYSCPSLDLEARLLICEALRKGDRDLAVLNPDAAVAGIVADLAESGKVRWFRDLPSYLGTP